MIPELAGLVALLTTPAMLLALVAGSIAGVVAGLAPGVSGRSALLIALPFVLAMAPLAAAVLLISLHASAQISGTVPAALLGAPTSASEAATAIDGYPLAVRGQGGRVVGAILASSALGGVTGAIVLLLLAPLGGQFILAAGTPEIAAFAAIGIIAIAAVSSSGIVIGIVVGAAGALASTIGFDPMTGLERFTFGAADIGDGLSTPAVVAGLIAVPELLRLYKPVSRGLVATASIRATAIGLLEPFRHGWLTTRSAAIGFVVGFLPGIGTSVAVWLAYGHAMRSTRPENPFGEGAIEGVIAPETANGSKEGGAYLPTLLLGVPGSSGMAIMLGAFAIVGIRVGPTMFTTMPQLPATVGFTMILADIFALLVCLVAAPLMVSLASLDRKLVTAISLTAATAAAYLALPMPGSALQIMVFGAIGVALQATDIARPPFLIGFIVGPILESALRRSAIIFGWHAFERPGVIVIVSIVALALGFLLFRRRAQAAADPLRRQRSRPGRIAIAPLAGFAAVFVTALLIATHYAGGAAIMPTVAAVAGLVAALAAIVGALRAANGKVPRPRLDLGLAALASAGLVLCAAMGPIALALPLLNLVIPRKTETE
jgi:putative tricarboxylic transport membrane protein